MTTCSTSAPATALSQRSNLLTKQPSDSAFIDFELSEFDYLLLSQFSAGTSSENVLGGTETGLWSNMSSAVPTPSPAGSFLTNDILDENSQIMEYLNTYQGNVFDLHELKGQVHSAIPANFLGPLEGLYPSYGYEGAAGTGYIAMDAPSILNINRSGTSTMNLPAGNAGNCVLDGPPPMIWPSFYTKHGWSGPFNGLYADIPFDAMPEYGTSTQQTLEESSLKFYDMLPPSVPYVKGSQLGFQLGEMGNSTNLSLTRPSRKRQRTQSPESIPQKELRIIHDELSMPPNFQANPDAHGRFAMNSDGNRKYLNGPKNPPPKRSRRCHK